MNGTFNHLLHHSTDSNHCGKTKMASGIPAPHEMIMPSLVHSMVARMPHQRSSSSEHSPECTQSDTNMNDLFSLLHGFPRDAFEPVPLAPTGMVRVSSSQDVNHQSMIALDKALHAMDEPRSLFHSLETSFIMQSGNVAKDALQSSIPSLDDPIIEPIPIKVSRRTTLSTSSSPQPTRTFIRKVKKHRVASVTSSQPCIRGYQEKEWLKRFQELVLFKEQHGHCLVPQENQNLSRQNLARWVKRQRYQYKLKMSGKSSSITQERIEMLQNIGFVWSRHAIVWHQRLRELEEYRAQHGDCNIPGNYPENQELAIWVKCQRRQYKLFWTDNERSSMTLERINALDKLGFIWNRKEEEEWI